ncbi:MAG: hypothetical protein AB3N24_09450, partial [Leisingera sp.]
MLKVPVCRTAFSRIWVPKAGLSAGAFYAIVCLRNPGRVAKTGGGQEGRAMDADNIPHNKLTGPLRRGSVKKNVAAIHVSGKLTLLQRKLSNVLLLNAYDALISKPK